jgi:carboxylesterase type B
MNTLRICFLITTGSIIYCNGALPGLKFKGVPRSFFEGEGPFADAFVTIRNGTLKGRTGSALIPYKTYIFQSIPYAKAPLGDLRFKAPEPFEDAWGEEVRDATKFPPSCPQLNPSIMASSEDCLFLNIYTTKDPATDGPSDLPVMVFIHGGGFATGESTYYSGAKLLVNGGVLVTLHYRLGPFGFLSTNDEVSPGNYGLKDIVQALRWVKENIAAFGGNSDNVTVFGQSAGGASSIYMLISPLARGLFHKVIAQSGSAISDWALDRKPFESSQVLAGMVGCPNATSAEIVRCLRTKPWEELAEAAYRNEELGHANLDLGLGFTTPTVEPDLPGAFITKEPLALLTEGDIPDVPVVLGATLHEGSYMLGLLYKAFLGHDGRVNDTEWMRNDLIPSLLSVFDVRESLGGGAVAETTALAYMPGRKRENFTEIMPNLVDMLSVFFMKASVLKTADILSQRLSSVYLYSLEQFSLSSMWLWMYLGEIPPPITPGITHADDLMYTFVMPVVPSPADTAFSKIMSEMWSNFARTGNPTPNESEQYPVWPKYTVQDQQYMRLNITSRVDVSYHSSWLPQGFVAK